MDYLKREDEDWFSYAERLIDGKNSKTIDLDKTEIYELLTGEKVSPDHARKCLTMLEKVISKYNDCKVENISDDKVLNEYEIKLLEIKKEKVKLSDQVIKLNKTVREEARFENLFDVLKEAISNSKLPKFEYIQRYSCGDGFMVAAFSDFHYGDEFKNYWGEYSPKIFERRFSEYISRIIEIGTRHNISKLLILGLGDLINGNIHLSTRINNNEDIIKQIQSVSEYIASGINLLSKYFDVFYHQVIGNHGRVNPNKSESVYVENFERFIPWYLTTRLSDVKNVHICEKNIDEGIVFIKNGNLSIVGVHGDLDNISNVVQNLTLMLGEVPKSVWIGHKYHFQADVVQGVDVIMSGSVSGTDEYAKNIRRVGYASQTVGIYGNDGILQNLYNVRLN